jgi:hypothetical protein
MLMTYYAEVEAKCHEDSLAIAENTYKAWEICAEQLGISVEEYIDFMHDMDFETFDYTLAEIEQMYVEYCREFEIPCMQIDIGVPMKLYGAI